MKQKLRGISPRVFFYVVTPDEGERMEFRVQIDDRGISVAGPADTEFVGPIAIPTLYGLCAQRAAATEQEGQ